MTRELTSPTPSEVSGALPPTEGGINEEQAAFFLENGYLVVPGLLHGEELALIDSAMTALIAQSDGQKGINPDFMFAKGAHSGTDVLRRIEYVVDKSDVMKGLLGHPFILQSVQRLMGPSFVPTWDSMVVKMPGEGVIVPWHRDDELIGAPVDHPPVFNVDFYLDDANLGNCLWVIPGSHKWTKEKAQARVGVPGNPAARVERLPFSFDEAIAVPLKKGDVIFHDVKLVHGSPDGAGNSLRRTVYYEFRPVALERQMGPHNEDYLRLKQSVLHACIDRRRQTAYGAKETPYAYDPQIPAAAAQEPQVRFRVEHRDFPFQLEA